jgi:hypothetical protein
VNCAARADNRVSARAEQFLKLSRKPAKPKEADPMDHQQGHSNLLRAGAVLHGHNHRCPLCGSLRRGGDSCLIAEAVFDAYGEGEHGLRLVDVRNTLCSACEARPMTRGLRKKLEQETDRRLQRLRQMVRHGTRCLLCLPEIEWHQADLPSMH